MSNKVVLAYSGGLDTTYCAVYLKKIRNYEHIPVVITRVSQTSHELGNAPITTVIMVKSWVKLKLVFTRQWRS